VAALIAPYVTADVLQRQPAGLAWNVVPTLTPDSVEQAAQLDGVCQQVTSLIDGYLNQPARAVTVTEEVTGPGVMPRLHADPRTGIVTLVTRRRPVISVDAVQVSEARAFPPRWTPVPLDKTLIRTPVMIPASGDMVTSPSGGNAVELAPGVLSRPHVRGYHRVAYSTTSGYPHTMLDATVQASADTLAVGDVTGWAGWSGVLLDGPATEWVEVASVTANTARQLPNGAGTVLAGPGVLTLASPLRYEHEAGALVTALPLAVLQAAALKVAVVALETLAGIAVQSSSGQLPGGLGALAFEAEVALQPYARIA
jgi:hypothetical protein